MSAESRAYYLANRQKKLKHMRAYYLAHREERLEYSRRNRRAHPGHLRRNNLKRYGITPYEYGKRLKAQDGKCSICRCKESLIDYRTNKPQRLSVDHCHDTNKIRGLLCNKCNTGLGKFCHDPALLSQAINYLSTSGAADAATVCKRTNAVRPV